MKRRRNPDAGKTAGHRLIQYRNPVVSVRIDYGKGPDPLQPGTAGKKLPVGFGQINVENTVQFRRISRSDPMFRQQPFQFFRRDGTPPVKRILPAKQ